MKNFIKIFITLAIVSGFFNINSGDRSKPKTAWATSTKRSILINSLKKVSPSGGPKLERSASYSSSSSDDEQIERKKALSISLSSVEVAPNLNIQVDDQSTEAPKEPTLGSSRLDSNLSESTSTYSESFSPDILPGTTNSEESSEKSKLEKEESTIVNYAGYKYKGYRIKAKIEINSEIEKEEPVTVMFILILEPFRSHADSKLHYVFINKCPYYNDFFGIRRQGNELAVLNNPRAKMDYSVFRKLPNSKSFIHNESLQRYLAHEIKPFQDTIMYFETLRNQIEEYAAAISATDDNDARYKEIKQLYEQAQNEYENNEDNYNQAINSYNFEVIKLLAKIEAHEYFKELQEFLPENGQKKFETVTNLYENYVNNLAERTRPLTGLNSPSENLTKKIHPKPVYDFQVKYDVANNDNVEAFILIFNKQDSSNLSYKFILHDKQSKKTYSIIRDNDLLLTIQNQDARKIYDKYHNALGFTLIPNDNEASNSLIKKISEDLESSFSKYENALKLYALPPVNSYAFNHIKDPGLKEIKNIQFRKYKADLAEKKPEIISKMVELIDILEFEMLHNKDHFKNFPTSRFTYAKDLYTRQQNPNQATCCTIQ